jgi:hypothetical protein
MLSKKATDCEEKEREANKLRKVRKQGPTLHSDVRLLSKGRTERAQEAANYCTSEVLLQSTV